jgi:hypothetical protein
MLFNLVKREVRRGRQGYNPRSLTKLMVSSKGAATAVDHLIA